MNKFFSLIAGTVLLAGIAVLVVSKFNSAALAPDSTVVQPSDFLATKKPANDPFTQSLPGLAGKPFSLMDYHGVKPVVITFWATWDPNAVGTLANLKSIFEKYQDRVAFVALDVQEDPKKVAEFVSRTAFPLPVALDAQGSIAKSFGVDYTNTNLLIDRQGSLHKTIPGKVSESDIEELLQL